MPTKRELMEENARLRKALKQNHDLMMQAAIKVEDLMGHTEALEATKTQSKLRRNKIGKKATVHDPRTEG